MIIKIHNQITFDINQIIDRHIQMHNQECVLINIQILTLKIINSNKNQTKAIREIETRLVMGNLNTQHQNVLTQNRVIKHNDSSI